MKLDAFTGYLRLGLGDLAPFPQDRRMPRGETASADITVFKDEGTPADLTGGTLVWTISGLFSRQADFIVPALGTANFPIASGDTWPGTGRAYPGDIVFIDAAGTYGPAGGRYQIVAPSILYVGPEYVDDPPVVTPAPSQTALAQGPPGGTFSGASLPSPTAFYRGFIFAVHAANGSPDAAYICLKLSDDSYGWFEMGAAP